MAKMSVSFDVELGEAIRSAAAGEGRSVSAWLADAAPDGLRLEALGADAAAWEGQFGPLTDAEVAGADRLLDQPPAKTPTSKARSPRRRGSP